MDLLSVREVAEMLGCSQRSIQKRAKSGKLPAIITTNARNRKMYKFHKNAFENIPSTAQMKSESIPNRRVFVAIADYCVRSISISPDIKKNALPKLIEALEVLV